MKDDADLFIEFGGTMCDPEVNHSEYPFKSLKSVEEYMRGSVVRNIEHTLLNGSLRSRFSLIRALASNENRLSDVINRVLKDIYHSFFYEIIVNDYESADYGATARATRRWKETS